MTKEKMMKISKNTLCMTMSLLLVACDASNHMKETPGFGSGEQMEDSSGSSEEDTGMQPDVSSATSSSDFDGSDSGESGNDDLQGGDESSEESGNESGGTGLEPMLPQTLTDEFDMAERLTQWTSLHDSYEEPTPLSTLEVSNGMLTLVPTTSGWHGNQRGAFLYKNVTGDFVAEVSLSVMNVNDNSLPPNQEFNSAGLLVRSLDSESTQENWVCHMLGRQAVNPGTEGKTTEDSNSFFTTLNGPTSGRLRLCRHGQLFTVARMLAGESEFVVTHTFEREDFELQETFQVGLATNGWNTQAPLPNFDEEPDVEAHVDYVRFWNTSQQADCVLELDDMDLM